MSWLSREINLITCPVIFYHIKCVVLNAALLFLFPQTVVLQMLHVASGLLLLCTLSFFHIADI